MPNKTIKQSFDIRFVDLDNLGHINNAVYLSYLEQLRVIWLRDTGLFNAFNTRKPIPLILARTEIDYLSQGYYKEKITCEGWVSRLGTKSFNLSYNIYTENDGKEISVAKAMTVLAWFDYKINKSTNIPENARSIIKDYLIQDF